MLRRDRSLARLAMALAAIGSLAGAAGAGEGGPPPPAQAPGGPSIHQIELERHRGEAPPPRRLPDLDRLRRGSRRSVDRVVYGYYPYWVSDLTTIRWSALTHLAWFAVEIDSAGQITARHGWPDAAVVDAAHAAGVRVDLTFTLFSGSGILTLCSDPARRATAIAAMIAEMESGGADGISVDFEGLIDGTRDYFTTFIAELRTALDGAGHPDAGISIAGAAVNWAGSDGVPEFDLDALLDSADYYFIMGYGYFWGGSSHAGPIGMMQMSADWRGAQSFSMLRSLASFSADVSPAKRHQIIHGVPYYGREWVTDSDQPAAAALSHIGAVTYSASRSDLAGGRVRQWDDGIASPWYTWQASGQWHQVWYDDEVSLAAKYQLALDQDIGGIGMWALNYDAPHAELWDQLETSFGAEPVAEPGHRSMPLAIDAFPFHHEGDTRGAPGSYFNYYGCAPDTPEYGREVVYRIDLCQAGHLTAQVSDGADVDVDLHLLTEPDQRACLARDDSALAVDVDAGSYLLVVDSFVANLVAAEGPYTLDVDFGPAPADPCPDPDPSCDGGSCDPGPHDPASGGCCRAGGEGPSAAALLPVVLLLLRRRRRTAAHR